MKIKSSGFTLIELLVVISIIAILSSVVLSSLNTARAKGADSAVKAGLKQLGVQAETYRDTASSFGASAVCTLGSETFVFNDPRIENQIAQIRANLNTPSTVTCSTDTSGSKWAVSVANLRYQGTTWCIDNSQGWFKAGTSAAGVCQ